MNVNMRGGRREKKNVKKATNNKLCQKCLQVIKKMLCVYEETKKIFSRLEKEILWLRRRHYCRILKMFSLHFAVEGLGSQIWDMCGRLCRDDETEGNIFGLKVEKYSPTKLIIGNLWSSSSYIAYFFPLYRVIFFRDAFEKCNLFTYYTLVLTRTRRSIERAYTTYNLFILDPNRMRFSCLSRTRRIWPGIERRRDSGEECNSCLANKA